MGCVELLDRCRCDNRIGFSNSDSVLGHAICIILGAAVGIVSGVLASTFDAPTWLAVVIGIIVGVGVISKNLEDRNADD